MKTKKIQMNIVILAAGKIDNSNTPFGGYNSYGMYPVRGKPFISWVINNSKITDNDNLIVVIDEKNEKLANFLSSHKTKCEIVKNDNNKTILTSLQFGLRKCKKDLPTKILLADTMIVDDYDDKTDSILTSEKFYTSSRWCLIEKDKENYITNYFDKQNKVNTENKEAVVGVYNIKDTILLDKINNSCIKDDKSELSELLRIYQKTNPLQSISIDKWLDFGNSHSIVKASHELFNIRHFNEIKVDERGILTKISSNISKLKKEYNWYQSLPEELKIFTPRVFSTKDDKDKFHLSIEMYGYQSLSEIFVYGNKNKEDWYYILDRLFHAYGYFLKCKSEPDLHYLKKIYYDKTKERLKAIESDNNLQEIINYDEIVINGRLYKNYLNLKESIFLKIESLLQNSTQSSVIHGDLCFSNILLDPLNYFFKFIDPRGDKIYGDPRYDIAKLRHSVVGLYDFIVLDEYDLSNSENSFNLNIFANSNQDEVAENFDKILSANNFILDEIKFIEALLFLTMIPLHSDKISRQKAFYLTAITKFNEILND